MPLSVAPVRAEASGSSHATVRMRAGAADVTGRIASTWSIFNSVSSRLLLEHDLLRKPVPTPHQVRSRLFRDHARESVSEASRAPGPGRVRTLWASTRPPHCEQV